MTTKRNPTKTKQIKVSLLTPIEIAYLKDRANEIGKCYGKSYDATEFDCAVCNDSETCLILFQDYIKKSKTLIEKKQVFLDSVNFDSVNANRENIANAIKNKTNGIEVNKLISQLAKATKMQDKKALMLWAGRLMNDFGLTIKLIEGKEHITCS